MFEAGQQVTHQGQTRTIADLNWNYRPACPCKDGCVRIQFTEGGYARGCEVTAATDAEMVEGIVSNMRTAGRKAGPLTTPGQTISMQIDDTEITVQYVRPGAYTVTCYQGSYRVDALCTSHRTEREARDVARGIATSYLNDYFFQLAA